MSSYFAVFYNASVFYPAPLRDLLMELATEELCLGIAWQVGLENDSSSRIHPLLYEGETLKERRQRIEAEV